MVLSLGGGEPRKCARTVRTLQSQSAAMVNESKTENLNLRMRPSVKATAERLAEAEGRSVANFIERLILADAAFRDNMGIPEKKPSKT